MVLLADHHLSLLHVPLHSALYFTTFQIMKSSFKTSRLKHSTSSVKSSHCHYGEELGGGRWAACPWSCPGEEQLSEEMGIFMEALWRGESDPHGWRVSKRLRSVWGHVEGPVMGKAGNL